MDLTEEISTAVDKKPLYQQFYLPQMSISRNKSQPFTGKKRVKIG